MTRRTIIGIVVAVALVVGAGVVWNHFRAHNIFEAIMNAEWRKDGPWALDDAWYWDDYVSNLTGKKFYIIYDSKTEPIRITIYAQAEGDPWLDGDEYGKHTIHPEYMTIQWTGDVLPSGALAGIVLAYNQPTRTLTEYVTYRSSEDDSYVLDDEGIAAGLAADGVTSDYLKEKRDWLLNDVFLHDFLEVDHSTLWYSATRWGDVHVVTDEYLT